MSDSKYNNNNSNNGTAASALNSNLRFLSNVPENATETNFKTQQYFSSYYVQNASFVRIDNINFGYDLGSFADSKLSVRANLNIQNAFIFTKYKGVDPEIGGGIDNNFFARPRVFVVGLTFGFLK